MTSNAFDLAHLNEKDSRHRRVCLWWWWLSILLRELVPHEEHLRDSLLYSGQGCQRCWMPASTAPQATERHHYV